MGKLYRKEERLGKTSLSIEQVIDIAQDYIKSQDIPYEMDIESIIFDDSFYLDNKPVWYISINDIRNIGHFLDAEDTLVISDNQKCIKYLINCHGRIVKTF